MTDARDKLTSRIWRARVSLGLAMEHAEFYQTIREVTGVGYPDACTENQLRCIAKQYEKRVAKMDAGADG